MTKRAFNVYATKILHKGARGAIKGQLLENGSIIAEFRRPVDPQWGRLPFEVTKYHSSAARDRFLGFCNCLSEGETIEALTIR